jgi:hypothetical protein
MSTTAAPKMLAVLLFPTNTPSWFIELKPVVAVEETADPVPLRL